MTYLKTIITILAILTSVVVLPFVLLPWVLGVGIVGSILLAWVCIDLVIGILLLADLIDDPDWEEDQ